LRDAVHEVITGEAVQDAKISLVVVDDETIHRLNRQFLNHDEPTDVITFPLSHPRASLLEGEIVIGAEVASAQAGERGHDVQAELALYAIHGALHLCGYDDHSRRDVVRMRERERHYLKILGLPPIAENLG
jgi:probable rRNA maturation factor